MLWRFLQSELLTYMNAIAEFTIMQAIKTCRLMLHEMDVPRISRIIKIGARTDREQTMAEKVASVRAELKE